MTREERAAQIWPLLTFAASRRQTITYEQLGRLIGVPRAGLGPLLEPIQRRCIAQDLPPLTSLVVSEISGVPAEGFTAAGDVPRAQADVFRFDWANDQPPTPEELG